MPYFDLMSDEELNDEIQAAMDENPDYETSISFSCIPEFDELLKLEKQRNDEIQECAHKAALQEIADKYFNCRR